MNPESVALTVKWEDGSEETKTASVSLASTADARLPMDEWEYVLRKSFVECLRNHIYKTMPEDLRNTVAVRRAWDAFGANLTRVL